MLQSSYKLFSIKLHHNKRFIWYLNINMCSCINLYGNFGFRRLAVCADTAFFTQSSKCLKYYYHIYRWFLTTSLSCMYREWQQHSNTCRHYALRTIKTRRTISYVIGFTWLDSRDWIHVIGFTWLDSRDWIPVIGLMRLDSLDWTDVLELKWLDWCDWTQGVGLMWLDWCD